MRKFLHKLGFHFWKYRNPYDRTCKLCRRHEVEYSYGGRYSEWEVYYDGDPV